MHAVLAFSAMHIAFLTDCPLVGSMAFEHRGKALSGLHAAIGSFSRESSDAILAASLVLSWQATDWYVIPSHGQSDPPPIGSLLWLTRFPQQAQLDPAHAGNFDGMFFYETPLETTPFLFAG